jgi:signal transduction histidine kinase
MIWQRALYLVPYLLSGASSLAVCVYCWRRLASDGARAYSMVALSEAIWTFGYVGELLSPGLVGKIFWDNVQYIGMAGWISAFLIFAMGYSGRRPRNATLIYSLISLPGLLFTLFAFIAPAHPLIRPNAHLVASLPFDGLLYSLSGLVWIYAIYAYSTYLICTVILLTQPERSHPLYRSQVGLLLVGNLLPIVSSVLAVTLLADQPGRDTVPLSFGLSNLLIVWALYRYRLFHVLPLARATVVEQLFDAVFVLDTADRLIDINAAGRRIAQAQGFDLAYGLGTGLPAAWHALLSRFPARDQPYSEEFAAAELGDPNIYELRLHPIFNRRGRYYGRVAIVRSITARRQAEVELERYRAQLEELVASRTAALSEANAQLRAESDRRERLEAQILQAQKLEAVGRLAGSVAHDFNNTLTVITSSVEFLLEACADRPEILADLDAIQRASRQGIGLTRQLLTFSRKQPFLLIELDLGRLIGELRPLLSRAVGREVALSLTLPADPLVIRADPTQIQQVLMNLALNARDAMPEGGEIAIAATAVTLVSAPEFAPSLAPGGYAQLCIADSGSGMSQETLGRLFEPFFTTKEPGRGTGLGLATVHGIVTQSGGAIGVASTVGAGTRFTIYLPLYTPAPTADSEPDLAVLGLS